MLGFCAISCRIDGTLASSRPQVLSPHTPWWYLGSLLLSSRPNIACALASAWGSSGLMPSAHKPAPLVLENFSCQLRLFFLESIPCPKLTNPYRCSPALGTWALAKAI